MERVHQVIADGADIVDIGGVPAAPGQNVDVGEEIGRTAGFVAAVRSAYPDIVISSDTWRHEVAAEVCAAGADLINDSWGGWDAALPSVVAAAGRRAGVRARRPAAAQDQAAPGSVTPTSWRTCSSRRSGSRPGRSRLASMSPGS